MRLAGILALGCAVAVAGCQKPPAQLDVTDAVVRLAPTREGTSVAYFTVHGGPTDDRLLDVISPVVIRTELHESMMSGNMSSMKPLTGGVAIPAGSVVEFKEGGKHLMMHYVNPGIVPGKFVPLHFTFASGNKLEINASVVAAGTPVKK